MHSKDERKKNSERESVCVCVKFDMNKRTSVCKPLHKFIITFTRIAIKKKYAHDGQEITVEKKERCCEYGMATIKIFI